MRLSHLIEQYLVCERETTVTDLARRFSVSEARCLDELDAICDYGIIVTRGGRVFAPAEID